MNYSQLPSPPFDALAGSLAGSIFMGANIIAAAVAAIWALAYAVQHRDSIPLYCMVGGFLAMLANEPVLDRLMLVWYPVNSPFITGHLYGTPMPLYLIIGYPWYVGLGAFVVHRALRGGISSSGLWKIFSVIAVLDIIIELPSTLAGVHIYFGPQPNFFFHGLSVTIPFVMSAISLICGFAVHWVLESPRTRWTPVGIIAIIPSTAVGVLVATQWPVMLAQNSTSSALVVWLAAAVSIALVIAAMRVAITTALASRDRAAAIETAATLTSA